jgi:glutathione S-transferase
VAAREKGLAFDWMPFDVPSPDPRAVRHNPERKSPKLVEGDFQLIESLAIVQYLDEAHPGRRLQPADPRERAHARVRLTQLAAFEQHVTPEHPPDEKKLRKGFEVIEAALRDGRRWLGGSEPDLSDIAVWPFLWTLEKAGVAIEARAYWDRARTRESLVSTAP